MGVSIKKNDFVLVQKGKDRGKKGRVTVSSDRKSIG